MALTAITLLCLVALLPIPGRGGRNNHSGEQGSQTNFPITVTVTNKFVNSQITYPITAVTPGMPMFGVLNKLKDTDSFNFTYSVNPSYGIFLESVNGLAGSTANQTYWELLSKTRSRVTPLTVGIGCYQPRRNENFIMNYTKW